MRDEHGGHEFLLELFFKGQFEVFDLPCNRLGLQSLVAVQEGDPCPVVRRIPDGRDMVEVAVGKHPENHRLRFVDIAPEGARKDHPVQFRDPKSFSTVGINSTVIQNYVKKQSEEQIREEQLSLWKDDNE